MASFFFPSSGDEIANQDADVEHIGYLTAGCVSVAGGAANALGTPVALGTASGAPFKGLVVTLGPSTSSNVRVLLDISLDNEASWIIKDYGISVPSTSGAKELYFPLAATPSNGANHIKARVRCASAGLSLQVGLKGILSNPQSRPLFTSMVPLTTPDYANTRPHNTPLVCGAGYSDLLNPTTEQYGAFMLSATNATANTAAQTIQMLLASGAPGSEAVLGRLQLWMNATAPQVPLGAGLAYEKRIPTGTRLRLRCDGTAANSDNISPGVYAFK